MWTHKVKCRIVPKDKGYVIMISAFRYWDFVFGYPLTVPYLQNINKYRTLHPKYVDTDAAINILGNNHKEPITMGRNPFCQEFEYVEISEVYWTYDQMVLQLCDCTKIRTSYYGRHGTRIGVKYRVSLGFSITGWLSLVIIY